MKLQEGSLTPLYRQVMDDIRHKIVSGHYAANKRIPSESALSDEYEVSRITIRRAVEELVGEGYLTKRQGKGTYVNRARLERKTLAVTDDQSFVARCEESGLTPDAHVFEQMPVKGSPEDCASLGVPAGTALLLLRRTLTADGISAMVESLLMPYARFSVLADAPLDGVPIVGAVEQRTGIRLTHGADRIVEVVRATAELSGHLGVPVGDPLFRVSGTICDEDDNPQVLGRIYMPTTLCALAV